MERLNSALQLLGVTDKTPLHVTHSLLGNILQLAVANGDSELEFACKEQMNEIQRATKR